jgi:hypothetical protein
MISGINGTNGVLSSMVKSRVEEGMISSGDIKEVEGGWYLYFGGKASSWDGKQIVLVSTRDMGTPRLFKSLDAAVSMARSLNVKDIKLVLSN